MRAEPRLARRLMPMPRRMPIPLPLREAFDRADGERVSIEASVGEVAGISPPVPSVSFP